MTDIVERLRDAFGDCHCGKAPLLDAASEIERLQDTIRFANKVMDAKGAEIERLLAEVAELQKQKDYWQRLAISRALTDTTP